MRRLWCLVTRHDWSVGEVMNDRALSRWRGCNRCGRQEVQTVYGRWKPRDKGY